MGGFVMKPEYAYANIKISKFDMSDKNVEKKLQKYINDTQKYPDGFVKK